MITLSARGRPLKAAYLVPEISFGIRRSHHLFSPMMDDATPEGGRRSLPSQFAHFLSVAMTDINNNNNNVITRHQRVITRFFMFIFLVIGLLVA